MNCEKQPHVWIKLLLSKYKEIKMIESWNCESLFFFFLKELKNNSKTKQNHTTFLKYVISWIGLGYKDWPVKDMLPALRRRQLPN